jgi:2'-5' RNA ligase
MRYFIGYLLDGEAARWHAEAAREISEKFETWPLNEKIPPHITIYRPFDSSDLSGVKKLLKEWLETAVPTRILISGFDKFEHGVVYARVEIDEKIKESVEELRRKLGQIPGMPEEDFPVWHPHSTLANYLSQEELNQVWQYVQTLPKPNFNLLMNNVTIFRSEGERSWTVDTAFQYS